MTDFTPLALNGTLKTYFGSPEFRHAVAVGGGLERVERLLTHGQLKHPSIGAAQRALLREGFALKFVSARAGEDLALCTCAWEAKWKDRMRETQK